MDDWVLPEGPGSRGSALRSSRPPDRDFENAVLQLLEHHGAMEGEILESYREIAERSSAGEAVKFLVRLILADEERHHELFAKMANEIRSILWEVPVEPRLPAMSARPDAELLAETKRLLAFEKQDAKELRALRKSLAPASDYSMDPLMVELMLHDTAKHITILEYIEERLSH